MDGEIRLETGRGAQLLARCTVPVPGVLRVRIGEALGPPAPSPMLVDFDEHPAGLATDEHGSISVTGSGVEAAWSADAAFTFGPYRRASAVRWPHDPAPDLGPLAGRILGPDGPAGFLEAVHLAPDAAVYGGGESFQGPDLRGRTRRLFNMDPILASGFDASYLNVPFFWSDAGWGLLVHSGAPVRADIAATYSEAAAVAVEGPELDLFMFAGDAPAILSGYHQVTGLPGAFPSWALGTWTSRCSYLNAEEIDSVLDGYEQADCPVDVVHVDAWAEGVLMREGTCDWVPDRARFPEGWARRLAERGVRVSLWHNPHLFSGRQYAEEARERGFTFTLDSGSVMVDFTDPDAVAWWKKRVQQTLRSEGNAAFKPDFGEEVPLDAHTADGRTGRAIRNEYAVRYQQATHEAMREALGTDEIALFCRSGTAGAHRYPCHWVGDTPSTWDGLVTALRACLSLSLSGFGFVAHDVGGFWTPASFGPMLRSFDTMDPSHHIVDVEPELYARWTQWGALSPVMRFHGTGRREPTVYPEPARSVAIAACRLRRSLRPYLEQAARGTATQGTPMMRPMALAYPGDRTARGADLQYLLGPDILVAPILEPGGHRSFWAPPGRWEGLMGLDPVEGPAWVRVACGLDEFPAFVRAD